MSPGIPTRLLATQSDERLLTLVRQGHERAFEALVHRYRKPLLGYCRRLRLSEVRAEDIVQLALLKAWIAIREGAEVRDLKAWLYRVVHNTAVNAMRDAAHDGEPLADPTELSGSHSTNVDESQLDRRLQIRETLAEVAALPPLQREVMVRTAVAGHSHEQVASDLGITNGAVRGLLYRARTTLRTAITALTPPQLLGWLVGRADQGGPAPERLAELAGGGGAGVGGAAGVGGLLLKGGVVAITAGTVITGAAVVHFAASVHHRDRHRLIAVASPAGDGTGDAAAKAQSQSDDRELSNASARRGGSTRRATRHVGARARSGARTHASDGGSGGAGSSGGGRTPQSTKRATSETHNGAPAQVPVAASPAPSSSQGSGQTAAGSGQGASQDQGSGQSGAGTGLGGLVGSAAGNGSGAGSSGGGSEGGSSGDGQQGSGSGAESGKGSGTGSSEGSSSQSSSSESSGSESSGEEHSGSLVGTVVHEVGSVLEHLLH